MGADRDGWLHPDFSTAVKMSVLVQLNSPHVCLVLQHKSPDILNVNEAQLCCKQKRNFITTVCTSPGAAGR